jgi:hydrogenase nickel incorporation protein HypA/HybF
MHEYSIVQALVDRVDAEVTARHATSVQSLSIRIGELSGVDPDLLTTAYQTFRERTICQGAELYLTIVPARWSCEHCGQRIAAGSVLRCDICGSAARLAEGDEIMLDRIEMEVP